MIAISKDAQGRWVWFDMHIESPDEAYISIPHWGLIRIWFPEAA